MKNEAEHICDVLGRLELKVHDLGRQVYELEQRLAQLEPPPAHPIYRNVTDECSIELATERVKHGENYPVGILVDGYRLSRVQLYQRVPEVPNCGQFPPAYEVVTALILERIKS